MSSNGSSDLSGLVPRWKQRISQHAHSLSERPIGWTSIGVKPAFLKMGSAHFSIMSVLGTVFVAGECGHPVLFLGSTKKFTSCDELPGVCCAYFQVVVVDGVDGI